MPRLRDVLLLLAACLPAGCDIVDGVLRGAGAPTYARVEVWNRTLEPIFLIDDDGRRLDVAPCEHAAAPQLRLNRVQVRTEEGYIYAFGGGTGDTQYLVFVADPADAIREDFPPLLLPPCQGIPIDQPGV